MRSVVKSSIGAGKTSTTHSHRYCCSSHTHDTPHNHTSTSTSTSTSLPRAALSLPSPHRQFARRLLRAPSASARRLPADCRLPATRLSPARRALHCTSRTPHHDALHTEDTVQHTASNVGTPQCPAFWPCQPRLSLSTPFPEEPSTTRPTDSFFCFASNPGTAHAHLSFLRISARALCGS